MTEASVSFAGNLTENPEVRYTDSGSARSVVEVVAEELGPSLRWATATTTRTTCSRER
jgi:single-stranded DNA-binding protein